MNKRKLLKNLGWIVCLLLINILTVVKKIDFDSLFSFFILGLCAALTLCYLYNRDEYVKQGFATFKKKSIIFLGGCNLLFILMSIYNIYMQRIIVFWSIFLVVSVILYVIFYQKLEKIYNKLKNHK